MYSVRIKTDFYLPNLHGPIERTLSTKYRPQEAIRTIFSRWQEQILAVERSREKIRTEREFFRRIPRVEWGRLLKKIDALDAKALTEDAIAAFQLGTWDHPVFNREDWPYLALRAHLEGRLEERYLPKLLLYDAGLREAAPGTQVETFQLIDGKGNVNPDALPWIRQGMEKFFSAECIEKVVERMRNLPPETSQFFVVRHQYNEGGAFDQLIRTEFHPFLVLDNERKHHVQTVLPPEFHHEILKERFAQNAKRPNPVLGFHKREKLSLIDRRTASMGLRDDVVLPQLHDYYDSSILRIYQHDVGYHAGIDSANELRAAWVETAELFMKEKEPGIGADIFDGDFPPYRKLIGAKICYQRLHGKELGKPDERFWGTLMGAALKRYESTAEKVVDLFWKMFTSRAEQWDKNYGLNRDNFQKFLSEMSQKIGAPDRHCISSNSSEHFLRLFGIKFGMQEQFQLWKEYPAFP